MSKSNSPPPSSPSPASRQSPLSSTPSSGNKLPKFLHRSHHSRDRSRSLATDGPYSSSAESEDSTPSSSSQAKRSATRKSSKLFGSGSSREKEPQRMNSGHSAQSSNIVAAAADNRETQTPTIIEPPRSDNPTSPTPAAALVSRSRTISISRPISLSTFDSYSRLRANGNGSPARLAEISGRLSGWFQHAFSSSTDLSTLSSSTSTPLPNHALGRSLPTSSSTVSIPPSTPKSQKPRTAAQASSIMSHIPGKANLERAVRWVLDSDIAQPDRSTDPIWIMGVEHPGYEPPPLAIRSLTPTHSHDSTDSGASLSPSNSTAPTSAASSPPQLPVSPTSKAAPQKELSWPPAFYDDFTSRVWLTYRSHYSPIRDGALSNLEPPVSLDECSPLPQDLPAEWWDKSATMPSSSPPKPRWAWGGDKSWTSDTGWGCMLRTGQSLLAEALIHLHLSRNWRKPQEPSLTTEYATYVKIITWFLDNPSPLVPFGVHRMALAGKALGKDVGSWFGPSTAAGAIKTLVNAFPEAGLSAAVAVDGTLYETDVYTASNVLPSRELSTAASLSSGFSRRAKNARKRWGGQAVLVLIGVRLGIDSVNPVYHESVKKLFTFPQSVGIAGGRPSSSYYFIGYQADNLFYLDPHHTRPAVPLEPLRDAAARSSPEYEDNPSIPPPSRVRQRPGDSRNITAASAGATTRLTSDPLTTPRKGSARPPLDQSSVPSHSPSTDTSALDAVSQYYATAYSPADLHTFHCDRVRKMPVSSLDPSMLLAFLCRDEADWKDLRSRVLELGRHHAIFSIQDEPPTYGDDSDSDVGMQSVSEPGSDLSSDDHTFESTSADLIELSDAMPDVSELDLQTPSPAQPPPEHFPFPGSEDNGDGDDDWVTPSTPPRPPPRRTHLRSQSIATPPVRSPATTITPSR